jgi:hypothetical protein
MKICILAPRLPFPELGGDVLRINNIAKYLKSKNHTIILVSYFKDSVDIQKYNAMLEEIYDKIYYVKQNELVSFTNSIAAFLINKPIQIGYYFSFSYLLNFKKIIKKENPDLYIAHLLRMVPYLNLCHLQDQSIVEMTDALSKAYGLIDKSSLFSLKKYIYFIEKNRIAVYEKKTIKNYKKCILVSWEDKEYLEAYFNIRE